MQFIRLQEAAKHNEECLTYESLLDKTSYME